MSQVVYFDLSMKPAIMRSTTNPFLSIKMENLQPDNPIADLTTNYQKLNSSIIEELDEKPGALDFMRYVIMFNTLTHVSTVPSQT
jgi:hypothetical protein